MSDCIIEIQIGDQTIRLNPHANIAPGGSDFLINTLDINKLRALYSNIKKNTDFTGGIVDVEASAHGAAIYENILASAKGDFISPIAALSEAHTPEEKKALSAYINSLDSNAILTHGDFLLDPRESYKLSPYSQDDIRNLIIRGSSKLKLGIYNGLISVPGMETLRMSIAVVDDINGTKIDKPRGVYLRPDNILQVLVPNDPKYYIHGLEEGGVAKSNLTKQALNELRDILTHELTHAVYSEIYIADPNFRKQIDKIHGSFIKYLSETNKVEQSKLKDVYKDPHEFLSDMFVNRDLQAALTDMISKDSLYESLGRRDLYTFLLENVPPKVRDANSSLKDALAIMTDSLPNQIINDTFESNILDYVDPSDKKNLFFMHSGVDFDEMEKEISPNDIYDSYWTTNAKAYRLQKSYLDRSTFNKETKQWSLKDAYYEAAIENPTQSHIDKLYTQDLVLIPWLRYNKLPDTRGEWIEQGVFLTKKGAPVIENGKPKVVDVQRNDKGEIVQPKDGIIEERHRHVPVMYSNIKKGMVVVAKVGLDPSTQKADYEGYNSISVPYSLIRGIRKYNWKYFDHNHDYNTDLTEAEANLKSSNNYSNGVESKFDRTAIFEKQIERARASIEKAEQTKLELISLHKEFAFNPVEDDGEDKHFYKNITEEDYRSTGYSLDNVSRTTFAPDRASAAFTIEKIKGKVFPVPNPETFINFWRDDTGKSFAKTSALVTEAVTKGDMIRIARTEKVEDDNDKHTVTKYEWYPVYRRVANGVEVATPNGKGMIINFNNIDAYAKNIKTESWSNLILKQKDAIDSFEDAYYLPKEEDAKYSKVNTEVIKFKPVSFDAKYWTKEGDTNESAAITRFKGNLEKNVIPYITPNESFVKVGRRFLNESKKIVPYQSLELVLAKTDDGLVTLRETAGGVFKTDHIKYADTINEGDNYGKELLFVLEDMSKVKRLWEDYTNEREKFEENKDKEAFTNEGTETNPVWKTNFDFKQDPRGFRDWYDLYDNVNGRTLSKLNEGDVIAIKIDNSTNSDLPEYYFRKVLRVLDDGRVAVADNRKEAITYKNGGVGKAGLWARYIEPNNIAKIGYRMGKIEGDKDNGFTSDFHQEIIDRRQKLMDYAKRDLDYNDFKFFTSDSAAKFNDSKFTKSQKHKRIIPLTTKVLDPKSEETEVYLDRSLNPVTDASKAAWVSAWFKGDSLLNAERGIGANTKFFKKEDITEKQGKSVKFKQPILDNFTVGDWAVTSYKDKNGKLKQWASVIDRIEGGNIYTINHDLSTSKVTMSKLAGLRTSIRNDAYEGNFGKWKRPDALYKLLSKDKGNAKASLDLSFKSPKDSRRALYEISNRLQQLNPDIKLNYVESPEVAQLLKATGFDYSDARAFVMNGEVFINTDKASISDVVHEYAHLFLHGVKYDNLELYNNIIESTKEHPLYDDIATKYGHLPQQSDVNEEVFVTLLGEYMNGTLRGDHQARMDENKQVVTQFSAYTKEKLDSLMSGQKQDVNTLKPEEILNMRMEDVITLVGDHVMNNRITDTTENTPLDFGKDVEALKSDLKKRGLLTEHCYG